MFKSIKARLTVIILFILILVLAVQFAANYLFAETFYINRKSSIMHQAYLNIQDIAKTGKSEDLVNLMGSYEDNNNLQFAIATSDYKSIYSSKQYSFDQDIFRYKIKANFDFKSKKDLFQYDAMPIVKEKKNNSDILILYGLLQHENETFYILIRTPIQAIKEDMHNTNMIILYISSFALVLGIILVYSFARKIAKPIEEIDRIALNATNLDFSERAPENKSNDEVGRLAKNINRMADKLDETITELKAANKELEKDNAYKSKIDETRKEFVANVSHELKSPLSVLRGYAEILKENVAGIDKEYYFDVIYDEVHNMTKLVNTLLELSTVENGLSHIKLEYMNITELVSNVLYNNDILFDNKKLEYTFYSEEHYYVMANRLYLERAICNYITNAIKYTEEGHSIMVSIKKIKKDIVVSVFNEGNHIDKDEMELIWERFYRSDKARTRDSEQNIGMGLYFVSVIMNAHQGRYGVNNVENGVEFWLSLKEA